MDARERIPGVWEGGCLAGGKVMNKKEKMSCLGGGGKGSSCCKVESLVSVDERGQMVLPKDLREKANIKPGDKLAVISWEKDGATCCFTLIKADSLAGGIRDFLGPMMQDLSKSETK
jgi:AbrB family looped-hinge helix DNA binding protein